MLKKVIGAQYRLTEKVGQWEKGTVVYFESKDSGGLSWFNDFSGNKHILFDTEIEIVVVETVEKVAQTNFTDAELLTIIDWFNGYCSRYFSDGNAGFNQEVPDNHRELIFKIIALKEEQ